MWNPAAEIFLLSCLKMSHPPMRINIEINSWRHQDKLKLFVIGKICQTFFSKFSFSGECFCRSFPSPTCATNFLSPFMWLVFFLRQINKGNNDDIVVINASKINLRKKLAERNKNLAANIASLICMNFNFFVSNANSFLSPTSISDFKFFATCVMIHVWVK